MKRRSFLSSLAMAAASTLPSLEPALAGGGPTTLSYRRVRPTDAAWPNAASWAKLNETVGGNLIKVHALFQGCQAEPNSTTCLEAQKNIGNPYWTGAPPEVRASARQTAMNPSVADAFSLVIIAAGEMPPAYPGYARPAIDLAASRKTAREIDLAAAELRKIAPNSGSYVSESNYFNRLWRQEYWGENYPKLRRIKSKYDAEGLFFVHHGVGSEEWSTDGFTRNRPSATRPFRAPRLP